MVHYARDNLALVKVSDHFLNVIIIISTTVSNIIIIRCSSETHTTQRYLGTSESVWFSFSATLEDWWLDFSPHISRLIGLCWQLGWQVGLLTGFSVLSVMELLYHLGLLASALFNRKTWFYSDISDIFEDGLLRFKRYKLLLDNWFGHADDIYIMMQCLFVTKDDHFLSARAERQGRKVRRPLGLAGFGLVVMIMIELLYHLGLLASTLFTLQTGSSWYQMIDCTWKYRI